MDCNLFWSFHINYISTKNSKSVGLIAKLRHFVPQETLITLYWALIHPYLNYGIAIWGQSSRSLFNKLLRLQKRVLRLIIFKSNQQSAIPLFPKTKIPPLNIMYVQSLMHDVINKNAPENLINFFTHISDIHQYATRSSTSKNLFTKPSRLNIRLNSFSRTDVRLWNSIPGDTRVMSLRSFKKYLSDHLFSTLESEDHYFDVSESIQAFSKLKPADS